jgi:hypothetical protein
MLPMISHIALLLAALPLLAATMPGSADAQSRSPADVAEAVVRSAFEAMDEKRWQDAAALIDPETLDRFRTAKIDSARARARYYSEPAAQCYDRAMPPEVVAWFEEQRMRQEEAQRRAGASCLDDFARTASLEELEALDPTELFARYLEARDPREQFERMASVTGTEMSPEVAEEARLVMRTRRAVIGSTTEDDSTVHVVYRTHGFGEGDDEPGQVMVLTARRTPQGWRIHSGAQDPQLFSELGWFAYGVDLVDDG